MTLIELNRKKTTFRNKVSKVKNFIYIFQPTDSTKDYITLKSKLDNIKSIIKELDILQNDYCALPDKINLNDALDSLSDLQDEVEETKKLCYLKGALKNEASLIQSDQDTFDSLLKALEVRYENTRALVDIHIAEILSINKLNSENPSQIRSIIDKARKCFSKLLADQIKINDSVTLQNSVFNYIVTGGLPAVDDKQQCFLLPEQEGLESLISKFWQLESIEDEPRNLNSQAKFCEEHFVNNHRRDESGQYIVQMAF
ncbi:integrase catalytic domain-containing protein [Trichonephila clavipes]|nr:integrase catalytic domain-containing protein [Trichonephila clavipes]